MPIPGYQTQGRDFTRLSEKEFGDALDKGLGRALIFARQSEVPRYQQELLRRLLKDPVYDKQCEASRVSWLIQIANSSGGLGEMLSAVIDAVGDANQAAELVDVAEAVGEIARLGSPRASEYLRNQMHRCAGEPEAGQEVAWALYRVEGKSGLLHALKEIGARAILTWPPEELHHLLYWGLWEERIADIREYVESNAADPAVASVLARLAELPEPGPSAAKERLWDLDAIFEAVERPDDPSLFLFRQFGRRASPAELLAVRDRLVVETREPRLIRLLSVFWDVPEVFWHPRWMELAKHSNDQIAYSARNGLTNCGHPAVREMALERLIRRDTGFRDGQSIRLLRKTYLEGDAGAVEGALRSFEDPHETHAICSGVVQLCKTQRSPALAMSAIWAYEATPCTNCRNWLADWILTVGVAPAWLVEECLHDCDRRVQETAEGALDGPHEG